MNLSEVRGGSRLWYLNDDLLFALGAAAWLVAIIARWPGGLSYSDEIGYLGQAKLLLSGHIRWIPGAPGIWNPTPHGLAAQYPLLVPVLLAPLFAIAPTLIFLIGVVPALALAWTASRVLKTWGHSAWWALIFLAHPTVTVLARTAMSDLLLSSLAMGAWWTLRQRRALPAMLLLAGTMAARPTGVPIAAAIVAGVALEQVGRARPLSADLILDLLRAARVGIAGLALGAVAVLTSNALATGTILFGYNYRPGIPSFRAAYFLTSAPSHLRVLLFNPPLLLLGALPLWRRRAWGAVLAAALLEVLLAFYVWVDWGPTWLETLVLSARLILPIVSFLLLGYVAGLATLAERLRIERVCRVLVMVAPVLVALQVGARHEKWHRPMRQARTVAARVAAAVGTDELGLNYQSSKAGLLYPGKTSWIVPGGPRPPLLLCGTRGNSYRDLTSGNPEEGRCDLAGYRRYDVPDLPDGFELRLLDGTRPRADAVAR